MRSGIVLVSLLWVTPAAAYVRTVVPSDPAACLFWAERTVHVTVNEAGSSGLPGDAGLAAVADGFAAWVGSACSDFQYLADPVTSSQVVGYPSLLVAQPMLSGDVPNEHLVVFRQQLCAAVVPSGDDCLEPQNDDCDNKYGCWSASVDTGGDALAYTLVTSVVGTGQILDADTAFDEWDFEFRDVTVSSCDSRVDLEHCEDLQNTMAHEAGHFLGLAHTPVSTATMFAEVQVPLETSKRVLDDDDVSGLCAIYPVGQPPVTCVPQPAQQVTAQGCSCAATDPSALVCCLSIAFGTGARRRRRL